MATTPGNATNTDSVGIVGFTGTAMVGTAVTAHDVMVGGSTSSTLSNVAPSATSGVALISQGASADPIFGTVAIAGGGTNATSMSTSTGIVKYDGTSLVTSTTAKIDSSNRMTNTSQPAFFAYQSGNVSNVTGDGTNYTIIFNNVSTGNGFDQASNFNTGTGTFTAPIAGIYFFYAAVGVNGTVVTAPVIQIVASGATFRGNRVDSPTGTGNTFVVSTMVKMAANDTAIVQFLASGGTKTVGINGGTAPYFTYFNGYLIC